MRYVKLRNFQSIRDEALIPLAPITLMYGPNSAGKSAVIDAIGIVNRRLEKHRETLSEEEVPTRASNAVVLDWGTCKEIALQFNSTAESELAQLADGAAYPNLSGQDRPYRNLRNNLPLDKVGAFIEIGTIAKRLTSGSDARPDWALSELEIPEHVQPRSQRDALYHGSMSHWLRTALNRENIPIAVRYETLPKSGIQASGPLYELNGVTYRDECDYHHTKVSYFVDGLPFLHDERVHQGSYAERNVVIHLGNPAFKPLLVDCWGSEDAELQNPRNLTITVKEESYGSLLGIPDPETLPKPWGPDGVQDGDFNREIASLAIGFCTVVLLDYFCAEYEHQHVGPNRVVPTPKQLRFIVPDIPSKYGRDFWPLEVFPELLLADTGLAEPAYPSATLWKKLATAGWQAQPSEEYAGHLSRLAKIRIEEHGRTLRLLNEFLLDEFRYQIRTRPLLKIAPTRLRELTCSLVLIELHSTDGSVRQVNEVGSGIGYVMPVLIALAQGNCCIEQPELHLHPALQSELGDLLIKAIRRNPENWTLIETHSEHVILRLLRRVRNTSRKPMVPEDLRLNPDDLCVLYFDPTPTATPGTTVTRVVQLRVDANGNFLDRWPNGFFEERDDDLFDEDE